MIRSCRFTAAGLLLVCCALAPRAAAQDAPATPPSRSTHLSLRDALAAAHLDSGDSRNARLAAALAEIRAEHGRRLQALAPPAPELLYHEEEIASNAGIGGGGQRIWQVSQEFDIPMLFGLHAAPYTAAERASEWRYEALRRELRAELIRAYARASALLEQVRLLRENARMMADFAVKEGQRVAAGDAAPLEAMRARSEKELARIALANGERDALSAMDELSRLIGGEGVADADRLDALPIPDVDPAAAGVPLERHPLAREAATVRDAAASAGARGWMTLLPDFRAAYFTQEIEGAGRFWGAELAARIPLWFLLGQRGAIEERSALAAQAGSEAELRFRSLRAREAAARRAASTALTGARSYADSLLPEAAEIRRTAERSFAAGSISFLEYIDAVKNANAILLGYHDAVAACYEALAELEYMTGAMLLAP